MSAAVTATAPPADQPPLRVVVVGWGSAARTWHRPLVESTAGMVLAGVVSRHADRVAAELPRLAVWPDLDAALQAAAPDLVVVATPPASHHALASRALAAGCHVLVEKPMTARLDEALDLLVRAEAAQRVLSVFHNRRWDGDFLTVRRLIAEGRFGRIVRLQSRMDRHRPAVQARWREQAVPGGGLWWDLGPHLLDQALLLFGWPDTLQLDRARQREGAAVDDAFDCTLHHGPARVHLGAACIAAASTPRFLVQGQAAGYAKHGLDPQEAALKAGQRPGSLGWGLEPGAGVLTRWIDGQPHETRPYHERGQVPRFYALLRDAIRGIGPNPVPAGEAAAVVALLELAERSAREGRRLPVRESLAATGLFAAPGVPGIAPARSVH